MDTINSLQLVETETRFTVPIAVVLERKIDPASKWAYPEWSVCEIVSGNALQQVNADQKVTIHADGKVHRFYHGGLKLEFFKDGSEGYWYNLLSKEPFLFVICEGEQGAHEIEPLYVTANQDEATGHLEAEDVVLSAPMPPEICEFLERYVVAHYQPQIKKKRKRKDWVEDSLYAGGQNASGKKRIDQ